VTLHVEAKTSPVIRAILTLAAYLYFYGVSVGIGNVQLAFVHAVIVFATFILDTLVASDTWYFSIVKLL